MSTAKNRTTTTNTGSTISGGTRLPTRLPENTGRRDTIKSAMQSVERNTNRNTNNKHVPAPARPVRISRHQMEAGKPQGRAKRKHQRCDPTDRFEIVQPPQI